MRYRQKAGRVCTCSRRARASATEARLAASISTMSRLLSGCSAARQGSQTPQGVAVGPSAQLSARARMRAVLVLPVPRTPAKR